MEDNIHTCDDDKRGEGGSIRLRGGLGEKEEDKEGWWWWW